MKNTKEIKPAWTRSNREEVIGILWGILHYASKGQVHNFFNQCMMVPAIASLAAAVQFWWKDRNKH